MFDASKIKALRLHLKMTQEAFAGALKVSVFAVRLWESGQRHPRWMTQKELENLALKAEFKE